MGDIGSCNGFCFCDVCHIGNLSLLTGRPVSQ